MRLLRSKKIIVTILLLTGAVVIFTYSTSNSKVDFNTEVKPILNKKCITCHGGVKRQGGFSVLFRSEALANTESGKPAIVPGEPGKSELIRRITLNDPEDRMPYKHEPLSDDEISTLKRWIKQGAQWGDHWAYVPVKKVEVPNEGDDWAKNSIDHFIYEKLEEQDLEPSAEAAKNVLLRRAGLDIIGMPASESLTEKFLSDNDPKAYENLVDSLLASPHYGEKWTAMWLDLARYADTKGYERDDSRTIWHYRDWLIDAFNKDMPYDQFITEQIAGDLLPNPTDAQYIATAFHRNTMTNDEGGTDNEEFRTAAVLDRVNTTWEVLMGTTFACVQCHSHPYDPFRHEEYYQFMAFFNNSRDEDTEEDYPLLRHFSDSMQSELSAVTEWLKKNSTEAKAAQWNTYIKTWEPSIHSLTADKFVNSELMDTKWLVFRNHGEARLKQVNLNNIDQLIVRYSSWKPGGTWVIHLDSPTGPVLKSINAVQKPGFQFLQIDFTRQTGVHDVYLTYNNPNLKDPNENGLVFDWFHFTEQFPGKGLPGFEETYKTYWSLLRAPTQTTPVMMENPETMHRTTNVFERGNWLMKGDEVQANVPHSLQPLPANAPHNRMGLAMWLTDKKNPLVARTIVNRVWEQIFGTGLVETLEDMGTQGAPPTHVELLDYLAYQFMNEYKWSVKRLVKELVMSATYRQDSKVSAELLKKDPNNKWYARGSRVRLSAEQVRDQALFISGLLNPEMKGPSVFPYQPKGIWLSPWNGADWVMSKGDEKYRRALYTYWKRTAPYPAMLTFDGPIREVCTSRRIRTNTPLQALVTLNDDSYIEMARNFAYRMQDEGGKDVAQQIAWGYEQATYKKATEKTVQALTKLYNESLAHFKNDKDKTCEMVGIMDKHNNPGTAAMVVVANAMLNLDELITKN
jgi:hypothetical protein